MHGCTPHAQLHRPHTWLHAPPGPVEPWDMAEPRAEGGPAASGAARQRCHKYGQGHRYCSLRAHGSRWWYQRGTEARLGHGLGEHCQAGKQQLGTRDPAWPVGVTSSFAGPCRRVSQLATARRHPPFMGTKTSPASVETWAGSCLALSGSAGCRTPGASPLPAGHGQAPAGQAASSPQRPASAAGPAAAHALPASAPSAHPAATLWEESRDALGCGVTQPLPPLPSTTLRLGLCRLSCPDLCQGASSPGTPSTDLAWERDETVPGPASTSLPMAPISPP